MLSALNVISWFIMIAWAVQAWLSALQVRRFVREVGRTRRAKHEDYHPPAVVVVPFKGIGDDLQATVKGLCEQDYPSYRLLFVVESTQDSAYPMLKQQIKSYPQRRIDLLVAGKADPDTGQKVHNQIQAIAQLSEDDVIWVFADSDASPPPDWLIRMVNPLMKHKNAMTTSYRWLAPKGDSGKPSLASIFASVMNSSVASAYRSGPLSHAWGGAMALKAKTAKTGDLLGYLRGALTDDYQFTRMCADMKRRVYFVPKAMVLAPVTLNWAGLLNFAHRQYLLTRVYAPKLYTAAIFVTSLWVAGIVVTVGALVVGLAQNTWHLPAIVLAVVCGADQWRSTYRRRAAQEAFGTDGLSRLNTALRWDRWATVLWMSLHWLLIVRAGIGRTMTWRGMRYRLDGPQEIRRIGADKEEEEPSATYEHNARSRNQG